MLHICDIAFDDLICSFWFIFGKKTKREKERNKKGQKKIDLLSLFCLSLIYVLLPQSSLVLVYLDVWLAKVVLHL